MLQCSLKEWNTYSIATFSSADGERNTRGYGGSGRRLFFLCRWNVGNESSAVFGRNNGIQLVPRVAFRSSFQIKWPDGILVARCE